MEKILIETYRGIDIEFDIDHEKFQCVCSDGNEKESASFASVKKFIDEYKKSNQDFKPFYVEPNPANGWKEKTLKVIGIRKDGRFVAENSQGKQEQISDHDLSDYMLVKSENQPILKRLKDQRDKEERQRLENNETRKHIISELNIVTLKDYKQSIN